MTGFTTLAVISTLLLTGCAGHRKELAAAMTEVQTAGRAKDLKAIGAAACKLDERYITPHLLSSYSDQTIAELFQTLRYPAVYLPDNETVSRQMAMILEEKAKRHKPEDEEVKQTFTALVEARLFESAEHLRQTFPDISLPKLPVLMPGISTPDGKWLAYDVNENGTSMSLVQLQMDSGPRIILFMLPGCPSGLRAIREILSDKTFGPLFRQNAVILLRKLDPAAVETLKKTFGFPAVYIAHKSADFPGIEMMHSPDCFFLKDGKVLSRHRGWSDSADHNTKLTLKGLDAIGIPVK